MEIRYSAWIEKSEDAQATWTGNDISVFEKVADSPRFVKEIRFYPSRSTEPVWLWVLGHEKATENKTLIDRMWSTRWVFHVCVKGKGYYNGQLIKRGTCFLSWPYYKHSIVADADDPFDFYWIILRGEKFIDFVNENGFRSSQQVFEIDCIDQMEALFEMGMNADYHGVEVHEYTMALVKMIFSFHRKIDGDNAEYDKKTEYGRNYGSMARQLLRDCNYSISIAELAKKMGLSPNYLSKVYSEERGETLKAYVLRKRFEMAEVFLEKGMPPTEVAKVLGYSDYTAFHRMFVSRFGMTPTQYVFNCKEDENR